MFIWDIKGGTNEISLVIIPLSEKFNFNFYFY